MHDAVVGLARSAAQASRAPERGPVSHVLPWPCAPPPLLAAPLTAAGTSPSASSSSRLFALLPRLSGGGDCQKRAVDAARQRTGRTFVCSFSRRTSLVTSVIARAAVTVAFLGLGYCGAEAACAVVTSSGSEDAGASCLLRASPRLSLRSFFRFSFLAFFSCAHTCRLLRRADAAAAGRDTGSSDPGAGSPTFFSFLRSSSTTSRLSVNDTPNICLFSTVACCCGAWQGRERSCCVHRGEQLLGQTTGCRCVRIAAAS